MRNFFDDDTFSDVTEGNSSEIWLRDDDPHAVRGMIASAYNLKYDGKDGYSLQYPKGVFSDPERAADYTKYLISLDATASKYLMSALQSNIEFDLCSILEVASLTKGSSMYLDRVAHHVYLDMADTAMKMRPRVVSQIIKNIEKYCDIPAFNEMLVALPELSAALVLSLARGLKTTTPPIRKRNLVSLEGDSSPEACPRKTARTLTTPALTSTSSPPVQTLGHMRNMADNARSRNPGSLAP